MTRERANIRIGDDPGIISSVATLLARKLVVTKSGMRILPGEPKMDLQTTRKGVTERVETSTWQRLANCNFT